MRTGTDRSRTFYRTGRRSEGSERMKAKTVRVMQAVVGSRLVALAVVAGTVLFLGAVAWA